MTLESKTYQHQSYESKWYQQWLDKGYFTADANSKKPAYTIVIPPPNVTDRLHMGHGLNNTIQDILIRYKRMTGHEACWLPGTDHAGIATQMMVEKSLAKEGKTKTQVGRKAFLQMLHDWKDKNGGIIIEQLKRLGCSADWSREAYTMDPKLSEAVREIFVRLYEDGLIYRGKRLVNWDPKLLTAISDDEVENIDKQGKIYHFKYPLKDGGHIEIATTRPETLLGDAAVAVHPEDERYKDLVGKMAVVPFCNREIPIIADEYVKMEFGSGALKITPAHDHNDFEVGKRHGLVAIDILNKDASLNDSVPDAYRGLDRFDAREKIVKDLKTLDLLVEIKSHKMSVPVSSRSKSVIEPKLSLQWYVNMKDLAVPAIEAANNEDVQFYPALWKKTWLYWLENIQDWCISRQLWWGHRIPIWYCGDCDHEFTARTDPDECQKCKSKNIKQDEDVLDTWFSSWLWPLSPFGWPEETPDLKKFFPSNVLVTGADIIFLWVARMVMVSQYVFKKNPFKDVYFNSIICDKDGKKFSKTLGNGIDPLEMIDVHGADAVRYTCVSLAPLKGRVRMEKDDFIVGAKFMNKIWNATKLLVSLLGNEASESLDASKVSEPIKDLLYQYDQAVIEVRRNIDNYRMSDAIKVFYQFFWYEFCDWGLEYAKILHKNQKFQAADQSAMLYIFQGMMRLAHPFLPFITEEIHSYLPSHKDWQSSDSLCISSFPEAGKFKHGSKKWSESRVLIASIRKLRAQTKLKNVDLVHYSGFKEATSFIQDSQEVFSALAGVSKLEIKPQGIQNCLVEVSRHGEVFLGIPESFDVSAELERLKKESARLQKILFGIEKKLSNKKFVDNAPEDILTSTKEQFENLSTQKQSVERSIQTFE